MNSQPAWLVEHETVLDGDTVSYSYDKEGDILEILFQKGGGLGIDLTDNIVLRFNQETEQALSLILTDFSRIVRPTKFGSPSFQLTALDELPSEKQQVVLSILNAPPVNHFLEISGLCISPSDELLPITYFKQINDLQFDTSPIS